MTIFNFKRYKIENIISLMKPCFVLSRLHCIFPYSYKISNLSISLSKPWCIISFIIMTIYFGCAIVIVYQILVTNTIGHESIPDLLQGICYVTISTFVGIYNFIHCVPRLSFLQDLFKISSSVPKQSFQTIGVLIHIKDIFGFIFLVGQIPNIYNKNFYVALSKAYSLYATLVIFLTDGLYMNIVLVLLICFKNINENLIKLKNNVRNENQLILTLFHKHKNSLAVLKLQSIKKMHFAVSEIVEKLNSTFSFQNISTIILTFAEVTFSLYFYLLHSRSEKIINLDKQIWYSYFITSVTYYSLKLTAITWACQLFKYETLLTGTLVHETLLNAEEPLIKDEVSGKLCIQKKVRVY